MPANAPTSLRFRRRTSSPAAPSRTTTTVAAGTAGGSSSGVTIGPMLSIDCSASTIATRRPAAIAMASWTA